MNVNQVLTRYLAFDADANGSGQLAAQRLARRLGAEGVEEDWSALLLHLNATLDHFQVHAAEKDAVVGFVQSTKGDIVEA